MEALAHRLASIAIQILSNSDLRPGFNALAVQLIELGPRARSLMPASFASLCTTVEGIEGVRFGELVNSLNSGGSNLDGLVCALVEKGFELTVRPSVDTDLADDGV